MITWELSKTETDRASDLVMIPTGFDRGLRTTEASDFTYAAKYLTSP